MRGYFSLFYIYFSTKFYYLGAIGARGDHVRLQESPFEEHVLIIECLVNRRQHRLSRGSAFLDIVASVGEDLRLHDGDEPILLTNYRVTSQPLSILLDAQLRRLRGANLEHGAPLGETGASLVELGAARAEGVEALGGGLAVGAGQIDGALVDLDAWEDVVLGEDVDEGLAVGGFLVEGFLEEDDAGEEGEGGGGGEEELAESLAVGFDVLNVYAGEPFPDGAGALVGG